MRRPAPLSLSARSQVRSYSFHFHARGYMDEAVADQVKKMEEREHTCIIQSIPIDSPFLHAVSHTIHKHT